MNEQEKQYNQMNKDEEIANDGLIDDNKNKINESGSSWVIPTQGMKHVAISFVFDKHEVQKDDEHDDDDDDDDAQYSNCIDESNIRVIQSLTAAGTQNAITTVTELSLVLVTATTAAICQQEGPRNSSNSTSSNSIRNISYTEGEVVDGTRDTEEDVAVASNMVSDEDDGTCNNDTDTYYIQKKEKLAALSRLMQFLWTNRHLRMVSIVHHSSNEQQCCSSINVQCCRSSSSSIPSSSMNRFITNVLKAMCMSTSINDIGLHGITYAGSSLAQLLRFSRSLTHLRLDCCYILEQQQQQQQFDKATEQNGTSNRNDGTITCMMEGEPGVVNICSCCHNSTGEDSNGDYHHCGQRRQQQQQQRRVFLPPEVCLALMENTRLEVLEICEPIESNLAYILKNIGTDVVVPDNRNHLKRVKIIRMPFSSSDTQGRRAGAPDSGIFKDSIHMLAEQSVALEQIDLIGFDFTNDRFEDEFPLDEKFIQQVLEPNAVQVKFHYCILNQLHYNTCYGTQKVEQQSTSAMDTEDEVQEGIEEENNAPARQRRRTVPSVQLRSCSIVWSSPTDYYQVIPSTGNGRDDRVSPVLVLDSEGKCQALSQVMAKLSFPLNQEVKLQVHNHRLPSSSTTKQILLQALKRNSSICSIGVANQTAENIMVGSCDPQSRQRRRGIAIYKQKTENTSGHYYHDYFSVKDMAMIEYICHRNKKLIPLLMECILGRSNTRVNEDSMTHYQNHHHQEQIPSSWIPKLLEKALECENGHRICRAALLGLG